jgi:hypothetical protein
MEGLMDRKWKRCGAIAILLGFGVADRCFGTPNTTAIAGWSRTAIGTSQVSDEEDFGEDAESEDINSPALDEIRRNLSAALKAKGSLKSFVQDFNNHTVQADYLKLIQIISDSKSKRIDVEEAQGILENSYWDPTQKVLLTRAIASAMGGAKWISKHIPGDPVALSTSAIRTFLELSEREDILNYSDRMKIYRQLQNNKVFTNARSPFWTAARSLTIRERMQLGDCFGPQSRADYEDKRKYFRLQMEKRKLQQQIETHCNKDVLLNQLAWCLRRRCNVDLAKNGPIIPEDFSASLPQEGWIHNAVREVLPVCKSLSNSPSFKETSDYQNLTAEGRALCEAFTNTQRLYLAKWRDLNRQITDLWQEHPSVGFWRLYENGEVFHPKEAALRRNILAGKLNATIEDCWDAITSQKSRFQELGTYKQFINMLEEYKILFNGLLAQYKFLPAIKQDSLWLGAVARLFNHCERFSDLFQKFSLLNSLQEETLCQLGSPAEVYRQKGTTINMMLEIMQNLLVQINQRLYSKQEQPKGVTLRQSIEKYLKDHPGLDATQKAQIQEILRISAKIKTEIQEIL